MKLLVLLSVGLAVAGATTFFKEDFSEGWESRWIQSEHKDDYGKFIASAGKFFEDEVRDTGLKTSQDARFYSISAAFDKFSNEGKDLVVQFSVKHEQKIDCGGGYVKLAPSTTNQKDFHGDTKYNIMFGPDICGSSKRTHVIFEHGGENHLRSSDVRCESDELTHLYTLVVKPDNTYEVLIDQKSVASGSIEEDWDILPPKEIEDPNVSKPEDWVDEPMMADPADTKPADWDDAPEFIADPNAEKPDDWDDDEDGEWEAPTIPNPEYKGEWSPRMIDNPDYKGPWVHPLIPNPEYTPDDKLYAYDDFGVIGIDIWQVKSGSIFDNIIITDSLEEANKLAEETFLKLKPVEKEKFDAEKEEEKKRADEERAKRDAEIKAMEDEDSSSDDDIAAGDDADAKRKEKLDQLKKKKEDHDEL